MAKVKVFIVEQNGEFLVQPPIVSLDPNDKLKIFNATKEDVVFRFANIDPVATPTPPFAAGTKQLEDIKEGGVLVRDVVAAPTGGKFDYEIFMRRSGKKAKGNSDPVIIIDN